MRHGLASSRSEGFLRRRLLAALVVLTAASVPWLVPRGARACSCTTAPLPEQALTDADAVFEARPFGMTSDDRRARYSFEVDRVFKGEVGPRVEISTALHSATCGRSYKIGTQYVVYARKDASGELTDMLCSRTRASASAAEDLQVLGAGYEPQVPLAPEPDPGPEPTEPPRIQPREGPANPEGSSPGAGAVEPPPTEPSSRGCAVEKPHASPAALALLGGLGLLGVANRRRRAVR